MKISSLKRLVYGAILSVVSLFLFIPVFAQDSTAVGGASSGSLPSWLPVAAGIAVSVYELLIRYIPTVKNYSIIGWVIKIIQLIVPNNNSATPTQPHS